MGDVFCLSNLLSLVGIAGAVLYFLDNSLFRTLIYIWIIAQVVVIDRSVLNENYGGWYSDPIWDLSQVFSLKFGLNFTTKTTKVFLNINILPLLYFGVLKFVETLSLVGKQVTLKKARVEDTLGDVFPLKGTVRRHLPLSGEKHWLLVELSVPFLYKNSQIYYVLIKRKNGEAIRLKAKNQIVILRLVLDFNDIETGDNQREDFPFVDWVTCE